MALNNLTGRAKRDLELINKAKDGNQDAFASLLKMYRLSVYVKLYKMVNNKEDAEDLTIETFGKAFLNIHKYQPTNAFSTWLYRIAYNNAIDFIRKNKNKAFNYESLTIGEEEDGGSIDIQSTILNPEEKAIKKQKFLLLRGYVEKLKPTYKKLIVLRYFKELSYEEIAEQTNTPLGTLKAQLHRARHQLLKLVKNSGEDLSFNE